jgi:hypothetical protein
MTRRGKDVAAGRDSADAENGIRCLHLHHSNGFGGAYSHTRFAANAVIIPYVFGVLFAIGFSQEKGLVGASINTIATGFAFVDINGYNVHSYSLNQVKGLEILE